MEKEFVPYKLALRLKALGFNEPCFAFFNGKHLDFNMWDDIGKCPLAPTFSQAFRWFREKYMIIGLLRFNEDVKSEWCGHLYGHFETHNIFSFGYTELYKTYEEAELACLEKLIEIVESKSE